MKKIFLKAVLVAVAALVLAPAHGFAMRGQGNGGLSEGRPGPGGPPPLFEDILEGTPFDITGEILGIVFPHGLELSTDDGSVIIRGLPPARFWTDLDATQPTVGETVRVTGYAVAANDGEEHYVAMTIVVGDKEYQLRDPETGDPAWEIVGPGDRPEPPVDITSGEAFDISGEVVGVIAPHGIEVETDDGNINLFGIGPVKYWEESGFDFPETGDQIQATGYILEADGLERYIIVTITIDGETFELRDSETGEPLWRMPPPRFEDDNE